MSAWRELGTFLGDGDNWAGTNGIVHRTVEHLRLSATAVAFGSAMAVPLGAWLGHVRRGGVVVQWVLNIGRAVPSLAILAIVFPLALRYGFGLGFWPTVPALVALAVPPLFANTYAGVAGVDPAVVEAARGMGLRPVQVLTRVELPNALPLVLTGLRVATLQVVATATLGAYVAFNGLGSFINEGFRQQDDGKLLTGALAVAGLALVIDGLLGVAARRSSPWRRPVRAAPGGTSAANSR
ncbi:MAG: ABC transporter permease [Acidimicrobiia bacterium]